MATINLGRIKPVFRGAYSGSTAYVVDDIVTHGNETFICIQAHGAGTQATSVTAYWSKLAAKGVDGTDVGTTITTQGDILYRDGSGLQRLAAGTSGQALLTGGAGANPSWGAAGISWQSVVTASTLTAVAGNAYPINTTSNTCTITLPAGSAGNRVMFTDYAANWGTNKIILKANGTEKIKGVASADFLLQENKASLELVYVDATKGWVPVASYNQANDIATEGIHWLVVGAGGGSAYDNGGGGGAGGMRYGEMDYVSGRTYTVVIGGGGAGGGGTGSGNKGGNSTFTGTGVSITSEGGGLSSSGGGGGTFTGGSGGGASQASGSGGASTAITQTSYETSTRQGYAGGDSNTGAAGGAGGGGAGAVGQNITAGTGQSSVGHGGDALANSTSGASVYYAGGGGGGANQTSQSYYGNGGNSTVTANKGGGGNGGTGTGNGVAGTANTGGGGGGGGQGGQGAAGGSGIAVFKMADARYASSTGSPTVDTSTLTDYTILTFNGNGTFTTA